MQWDYNFYMKKSPTKTPKKAKNLEEKVDFIVDYLQTKVATKEDLHNLEKRVIHIESDSSEIKTAVANLAKQVKDYHQEMIVFTHKVERMEAWIKKVSLKVGIPYEF